MWHVSHANPIPFVSGPMYNYHISTKGYNMVNSYDELMVHFGHKIEIANYAGINVSAECYDCSEVLLDFDKE
jgi:hypothetical protein